MGDTWYYPKTGGKLNFKSRQQFGHWLFLQRRKRNLSQWQIAESLGYGTAQFISNWERGVVLPAVDSIPVLSGVLGVSARTLVSGVYSVRVAEIKEEEQKVLGSIYKPRPRKQA